MTRSVTCSYVLITPARNEEQFIERTITSVVRQTLPPLKWVIVSDGSTDNTDDIVKRYATQYEWIQLIRMPERSDRHFAAKVEAFNAGYAQVTDLPYQVIGNLDADVSFEDAGYFEFLMTQFVNDARLGVCGTSYREENTVYPGRFTSLYDVFGACQMFRRECFEAIGGYLPAKSGGIDLIAFLSARAKGWQTRTFTERICTHRRKVGSAQYTAALERLLQAGQKDYLLGCHPAWELFRSLYRMNARPYFIGGLLMLLGYLGAMCRRVSRTMPKELIALRQTDQLQRLKQILLRTPFYSP
jgi:poly-beta-1,6-N-acetyl-D-glucosamine synthase